MPSDSPTSTDPAATVPAAAPLLGFYGDDFTSAVEALEALALAGLPAALFTRPPGPADLAKHPGVRAIGIAGRTRFKSPADTEGIVRLAFESLRAAGVTFAHYVASTRVDNSPISGNLGRVIDVGLDVFGGTTVPVLLDARADGVASAPPLTADGLRKKLAAQTALPVELLDDPAGPAMNGSADRKAILIESRLDAESDGVGNAGLGGVGLGSMLLADGRRFAVGSAAIDSAIASTWSSQLRKSDRPTGEGPGDVGPVIAACGSCARVTSEQIRYAIEQGFAEVILSPNALHAGEINNAMMNAVVAVTRAIGAGRNVVLHTDASHRVAHTAADDARLGATLGHVLRLSMQRKPVKRILLAGSATAGRVADSLGIHSLSVLAPFTPGSPLCVARSANRIVDGLQVIYKSGSAGPTDLFARVRCGKGQ